MKSSAGTIYANGTKYVSFENDGQKLNVQQSNGRGAGG